MVCGVSEKGYRRRKIVKNECEGSHDEKAYPTAKATPRRLVFVRAAVNAIWRAAIGPVSGRI